MLNQGQAHLSGKNLDKGLAVNHCEDAA